MEKLQLQPDVAAKYDLITVQPGTYLFPGYGEVSLQTLSAVQADKLVASGFPYLKAKPDPKPQKAAAPKQETAPAPVAETINEVPATDPATSA